MVSHLNKRFGLLGAIFSALTLSACITPPTAQEIAVQSDTTPGLVYIPPTRFFMGSTAPEVEAAYRIDEDAYTVPVTRQQNWYEFELPQHEVRLREFFIARTPITNAQYHAFIKETGYPAPNVDIVDWQSYGVNHPYESTRKYAWTFEGYPTGRGNHPVVLVNIEDAQAYARWLTRRTGQYWRLPTEAEWELAAKGPQSDAYPWGPNFNPAWANTADLGPYDTMPVGSFAGGASPFGVLDMAGQVYEWTSTPGERSRMVVKGGSWDDRGCGVCRSAARHHRHYEMKHTIIGFRLVMIPPEQVTNPNEVLSQQSLDIRR